MGVISLIPAQEKDLPWINKVYDQVGFVGSTLENEYIILAFFEDKKGGLGRLVKINEEHTELGGIYVLPEFRKLGIAEKIVSELCENNPFKGNMLWCLPFKNLVSFYSKFGFSQALEHEAPPEIQEKLIWCNEVGRYTIAVHLLGKKFK